MVVGAADLARRGRGRGGDIGRRVVGHLTLFEKADRPRALGAAQGGVAGRMTEWRTDVREIGADHPRQARRLTLGAANTYLSDQ